MYSETPLVYVHISPEKPSCGFPSRVAGHRPAVWVFLFPSSRAQSLACLPCMLICLRYAYNEYVGQVFFFRRRQSVPGTFLSSSLICPSMGISRADCSRGRVAISRTSVVQLWTGLVGRGSDWRPRASKVALKATYTTNCRGAKAEFCGGRV